MFSYPFNHKTIGHTELAKTELSGHLNVTSPNSPTHEIPKSLNFLQLFQKYTHVPFGSQNSWEYGGIGI